MPPSPAPAAKFGTSSQPVRRSRSASAPSATPSSPANRNSLIPPVVSTNSTAATRRRKSLSASRLARQKASLFTLCAIPDMGRWCGGWAKLLFTRPYPPVHRSLARRWNFKKSGVLTKLSFITWFYYLPGWEQYSVIKPRRKLPLRVPAVAGCGVFFFQGKGSARPFGMGHTPDRLSSFFSSFLYIFFLGGAENRGFDTPKTGVLIRRETGFWYAERRGFDTQRDGVFVNRAAAYPVLSSRGIGMLVFQNIVKKSYRRRMSNFKSWQKKDLFYQSSRLFVPYFRHFVRGRLK